MSKILKITAAILCILGFIGSIASAKIANEFSFTLFLGSFSSIAISSAVLFAIGQILDNQEMILGNQAILLKNQEPAAAEQPQNENKSVLIPSARPGYWQCKSCHTENPSSRKTCLECGAPK
ncbi:MAG: hypothetical protein HFE64_02675 [Lachnospiraceae bacterium]|jgi:hypothetical protein|nr:hypothetical protein [Lachnospiraceae bacterium]